MELTSNPTESESEPKPKPTNPISFSNGTLKRHSDPPNLTPARTHYKECLKNHAATLGGHALDGCCEFMLSPLSSPSDPTSLKCAACGCHRNFHRRTDDDNTDEENENPTEIKYPPKIPISTPLSPLASSYFNSAPQMLLALSTGVSAGGENPATPSPATRKRFRTKFSREQKEKMYLFSEKLGWKMQRENETVVEEFCNEIGIGKGVLKVWMHNNKNTFVKRDVLMSNSNNNQNGNGNTHLLNGSSSSS
ncbi:zinc-finger homeodomain protein 9-like [Tasmannia lanceolata]|uniref:zinc-finger homeodomain protein 9-like n=1 Tax=Tasmannia lanceolata TaxID=3420 RepID=UPI00406314CF